MNNRKNWKPKNFPTKEIEEQAKKESAKTFTLCEVLKPQEVVEELQAPKLVALTPEQIIAIKAAIVNSQTLEEVAKLEKADLKIPADTTGEESTKEDEGDMNHVEPEDTDTEPKDVEDQSNKETIPMKQE